MIFNSLLIANRGEIACRIIKTAKEMGIRSIAVYVDADRDALFVNQADESIRLEDGGYLDGNQIIMAAKMSGAQAIHPGYGFLSENASFARKVKKEKIIWVGPSPNVISVMGDKLKAKELAIQADVPTLPMTSKPNEAKQIGYPLLIKAAAGGGGKGMRIVTEEDDLNKAINEAKIEAKKSFNDENVYLEKFLTSPKHIEIQVLCDSFGNVVTLGERDCSIQRKHQKLIEESPSSVLTNENREKISELCRKSMKEIGYEGVGTLEFLYENNEFYFMEMNTRLQVEHPGTEMVTGIDLVKEQILVANGEKLKINQEDIKLKGSSIECRINAEHPESFIPSPGKITQYHQPGGLGIRVDSAVYDGYSIPSHYDSMIGKLITYGATRSEALKKMNRALEELSLIHI